MFDDLDQDDNEDIDDGNDLIVDETVPIGPYELVTQTTVNA